MAIALEKCTLHTAVAVREVVGLEEMGTMCAVPVGVRWVSFGEAGAMGGVDGGLDGGLDVLE